MKRSTLTSRASYNQAGSTKEVDRPAENGDTVNIDYVGKKDGVAFDGGTASGYDLALGSGSFIDGFEDGLIGVKKGDQVTLNLTFPEQCGSTVIPRAPRRRLPSIMRRSRESLRTSISRVPTLRT